MTAYRELQEELGITGVKLEEIGYFHPDDIGTFCFSKLYKFVYNGDMNLDYDKDGIREILLLTEDEIISKIKTQPEKFKDDFIKLFTWMMENKK